ncbi:MAG: Gmad2 immunoglobulin-like domain-containing protein, partial [Acidimicrobiia bacterium]
MSYEKKMKDLLGRLVSMSPEPPPYPEDIQMAAHKTPTRWSPALVFAGAALVVIALAIPLLLFVDGEGPEVIATTTTTTVPATSTTTVPPSTTSTIRPEPIEVTWAGVIYLYQSPENSFLANPALVPVQTAITGPFDDDVDFSRALAALIDNDVELPGGLMNAIPADVHIVSLGTTDTETGDQHFLVDMNEAFLDGAGGLLADFTMLNQLVYTLSHDDPEMEVIFTVNQEPIEAFGSDGLDLSEPVGRDEFLEDMHVINLTQALVESEGGYLVEGIANVFEATVNIAVLDATGEVVHEEFVTATCGSGCWG